LGGISRAVEQHRRGDERGTLEKWATAGAETAAKTWAARPTGTPAVAETAPETLATEAAKAAKAGST
jgi:hypothetical protein